MTAGGVVSWAVMALVFGPLLVWILMAWGRALAKCEEERRSGAVPASEPVSVPGKPQIAGEPGRPPGDRQCRRGEAVKGPAGGSESSAPEAKPRAIPEYLRNDFRAAYVWGFIESNVAAGVIVRAARRRYRQAHVPYLGLHMGTSVRPSGPRSRSGRGTATAGGRQGRTGPPWGRQRYERRRMGTAGCKRTRQSRDLRCRHTLDRDQAAHPGHHHRSRLLVRHE